MKMDKDVDFSHQEMQKWKNVAMSSCSSGCGGSSSGDYVVIGCHL
jgi:hypothetical protein